MSIPAIQKLRIGMYLMKQVLKGRRRPPLVLMLEPLFQCNLRCIGCGKIAHSPETLAKRMAPDACVAAAESCGAPVVSIAGGEPLLHPGIHRIADALVARKRFVYLCTNALCMNDRIADFQPSSYLTFNIHLDGLRERHDALVGRQGVFDTAVTAIRMLRSKGFRVTTNTTFYDGETPQRAARFLDFVASLGVEGMTIAPGFGYEKAAVQAQFPGRAGTTRFFRQLFALGRGRGWVFNHSRLYLEFLAGRQTYACSPWGNPTYTIFGWQRPCYLIDDGYAPTYPALMADTDWSRYGVNADARCENCMVHCGFEPSAVLDAVRHPVKLLKSSRR